VRQNDVGTNKTQLLLWGTCYWQVNFRDQSQIFSGGGGGLPVSWSHLWPIPTADNTGCLWRMKYKVYGTYCIGSAGGQ
jgi:hypothetical protein